MKRFVRACAVFVFSILLSGGIGLHSQSAAPPILVVVNSASSNPYGPYLAEILKAEGLNSFTVAQLSTVTATTLNSASVVVLAETALTTTQATMFTNFVAAGGRLVTMRPDSKLLSVLGISPAGTSTSEGYFAINQAASFEDGFPTATMPFHGQAQNYLPSTGTQTLATIYSDSVTPTSFPAVVKAGSTVTWTYDLARSVIYTRQGNPANASDRDGTPLYRTEDIFYNAIDKDKVIIPYADVQMRMFARAITDLLGDVMPMPRLWYFPGSNRTLVVLTGDSHSNPSNWFDIEVAAVEARGGHMSIYAYNGGPTPDQVHTWRANGHEVGMHPAAFQYNRTIDAAITANEDWFAASYDGTGDGTPSPTVRLHQVEWQGWVDAAKVMANHNLALDTSFYTWGPAVTYPDGHQAHGYINGSGQPMRFIDSAGAIVPVYQQVTSLIDEALVISDLSEHLTPDQALAVSRQLIDNSQAGDYAAITTQFHIDYFQFGEVNPWALGTMDYAQSLGIPMWTAERWLNYTTARSSTTVTGYSWSALSKQLSFTVTVPAGAEAQTVLLPGGYNNFGITTVTRDGSSVSTVAQTIGGRAANFLTVAPGTHNIVVTYTTPIPPPEHPPIAVNDSASVTEAHTVTIPVLANDTDADGDPLTVTSIGTDSGAVITLNSDQTISYAPNAGTCGTDRFTYTISDGRGGSSTGTVTATVTCLNGQITQTTVADDGAACAIRTNTIVTTNGDGDIRLAGTQSDDYTQSTLNAAKWVAGTFSGGAYTPTIANGILSISNSAGGFVRSAASAPLTTIEASATFSGQPFEHIGWGSLNFSGGYAIFSTYNTSTNLFARTSTDGSTEQQTNLGTIPAGFHIYRIDRQVTSPTVDTLSYYLDGVLKAQHSVPTMPAMYVYQSNSGGTAHTLDIDSISAYPTYVGSGTYQSCTQDIGHTLSTWTTADWSASVPAGTTLQMRTRTSTDGTTWSGWSAAMTSSGADINSPSGRYLQYLLEFTSSNPNASAVVNSVTLHYQDSTIPINHAPVAISDAASTSEGHPVTVPVLSNDSDPDGDPLTVSAVTQGAKGSVVLNPDQTITYTPNGSACGADSFTYTISDGRGKTATTTVSVNIACLSGQITQATLADFGPACSIRTNTLLTANGDGEIRLAGVQGDEYNTSTLDPALWVGGTWAGGAYSPVPAGGLLSISDPNGAFVRSATSMPVTTLESSVRFASLPWQHVGWASLDFTGDYAIFSTYNSSTNLFARTNDGNGEQQANLGPIPTGFHTYRVSRTTASPSQDTVSYYIDGVLVASHTVVTLTPPMYIYQSHNGGTAQTLDIDWLWAYPAYQGAGSFQSCTIDGGASPFNWTAASWAANVPASGSLQLSTRTSTDGTTWSDWSSPATTSGSPITSPVGRYLQYQLALTSGDPAQSPVVDSITLQMQLSSADSTPPALSNIAVSTITSSSAVVSWVTSEPATSLVQFGPTRAYGQSTALDSNLVTSHAQTLTGLTGGTLYNFRVISKDAAGNESDSANGTFTTVAPTLSINDVSVTEGNAGTVTATFAVSLSSPANQTVTVSYATANGTATAGSDYTAASGTVTFAPGMTSQPVAVIVNGDTVFEANETFFVNLTTPVGATISDAQGIGTIVNDDTAPTLSINDISLSEGNSGTKNATFTVTLSAASGATTTVNFATADGTATTANSDYTAASGTLTFNPGVISQTLNVSIIGNTTFEPDETFFVNLTAPVNASIVKSQGVGTIQNDDAPSITIADASVTEGNSGTVTASFPVTLSGPTTQTVTVTYSTANGTALSSSDYNSKTSSVTFAPGTTSATATVTVNGDTTFEPNETFFVNLSNASNATIARAQATGTIVNDDTPPTLSINDISLSEGNSGTKNATFTVTLSPASSATTTVHYATADGTATTANSDYTATSGTLTFNPGVTSQTLNVSIIGNTTFEPDETFFVNLTAPVNASIVKSQGVGTIQNDDAPSITIADASVTEGNSGTVTASFPVTLSGPTTQTVTVTYSTANGTALSSSDYNSKTSSVTFAPGTTSATATVTVNGDTTFEPNETFFVNLSNASNATIARAQATGTIVNDDTPPTLSIGDTSVTEGNSGSTTMTFTVTLSAASSQTVTVNYATANGTATAGSDYTATSGTLTFTAGQTSRTFNVTIAGDTTPEANETVLANLSNPTNATIADAQGIGTINDNDGTIAVTSPNTNVTWAVGSVHAITWTHNLGVGAPVLLEVSRDGGSTWTTITTVASSGATSGTFNWTVTGPATTLARVRATWTTNTGVTDASNVNFRIQ